MTSHRLTTGVPGLAVRLLLACACVLASSLTLVGPADAAYRFTAPKTLRAAAVDLDHGVAALGRASRCARLPGAVRRQLVDAGREVPAHHQGVRHAAVAEAGHPLLVPGAGDEAADSAAR